MPAKRFLQPRISTRYSTAPTAKPVLMSIRGYDPLVQALRLPEQYTRYLQQKKALLRKHVLNAFSEEHALGPQRQLCFFGLK